MGETYKVSAALGRFRAEGLDGLYTRAIIVDAHSLPRIARRIMQQVVMRRDQHRALRRAEHRIRQIARMRHMMHPQIKPQHNIRLIQRLAVEVLREIDDGVGRIVVVQSVGGFGLGIVLDCRVEVVCGEGLRVEEVA